jgi:plasmid stabilization system protein ParE
MRLEWSAEAMADLDRFAEFLRERYPQLSKIVAHEIVAQAQILAEFPQSGRVLAGRPEYRQLTLVVLNAAYIFQYRYDGRRLVMLRVKHGSEDRA